MNIRNLFKTIIFGAFAICISPLLHADLVWTQDKGWVVEGGVLANVLGEATQVKNALEAMNEGKKAQDAGNNWFTNNFNLTNLFQFGSVKIQTICNIINPRIIFNIFFNK